MHRALKGVQDRVALQLTCQDIVTVNASVPPTERLAAGYVPAANKIYLIPVS
jgi:hypothetical protein